MQKPYLFMLSLYKNSYTAKSKPLLPILTITSTAKYDKTSQMFRETLKLQRSLQFKVHVLV